MNKPKILFPVETTVRELVYKLALSARFAELGYECYLGSKDSIHKLFGQVKPFVYFDKGYHAQVSEALYDIIRKNEGIIVNLDEEGGVDFKDSSTILSRYPEKVFHTCDLIFLWGEHQYCILKGNRDHLPENKIIVSGHPRFELLKPPFHALYEREVEAVRKRFQNYILFNTNMGFGNNIWGDAFVRKNYGARIKEIEKVIEFDKVKVSAFVSLIRRLAPLCQKNIVLRPHPEENRETYSRAFQDLGNVQVIFEGSVIPWLIGADVMIHPDCTTGIEFHMLGKRPISYLPSHEASISTFLPVQLSHQCQSEQEVVDLALGGKFNGLRDGSDTLLNEYFSYKRNSTDTIVESVHNLLCERVFHEARELSLYHLVLSRIKEAVRPYYYKVTNKDLRLYQNKLSGLDLDSVSRLLSLLCRVFHVDNNLHVQAIHSHLFSIKN